MPRPEDAPGLLTACALLFGPGVELSSEFLRYLQPGGLRSAYRRRAMEAHPDRAGHSGEDFLAVQQAYAQLREYLQVRDKGMTGGASFPGGTPAADDAAPSCGEPIAVRPFTLARPPGGGSSVSSTERFYKGPMPRRELLFGNFLYYAGLTNWRTITRILTWQRLERPRLGELCRSLGWLNSAQIARILASQQARRPFGETAVSLGLLSGPQVELVLARQQRLQKRFGTILLEKRLINRTVLRILLARFQRHNAMIRHRNVPR